MAELLETVVDLETQGSARLLLNGGRASPVTAALAHGAAAHRSEEHTSELQSLMRISYAVFCLKKKHNLTQNSQYHRLHTLPRESALTEAAAHAHQGRCD